MWNFLEAGRRVSGWSHSIAVIAGAGEAGQGDREKRSRDGEDDVAGEAGEAPTVEEGAGPTPEAALAAEFELLKAREFASLDDAVAAVNATCKNYGYKSIWKKDARDSSAYFFCGCGDKKCFKITFSRPAAPTAGEKKRKSARVWTLKSFSAHLCEPDEPRTTAIAATFIPEPVKEQLIKLWDLCVGVGEAHRQAAVFAEDLSLPTTWRRRTSRTSSVS